MKVTICRHGVSVTVNGKLHSVSPEAVYSFFKENIPGELSK